MVKSAPAERPPRRLITDFDVKGNANRAHSSVQPGGSAFQDKQGRYVHEPVWRYIFTHPGDAVGEPVQRDPGCDHVQTQ